MTTPEDIIDTLSFFDSWEDRYKYMIDLGKSLPPMDDALKTEERLVPGCQSLVWIEPTFENDKFSFQVDSDALIVRGLLAIVMAAYNNKSSQQIIEFDIQNYFSQLDLIKHLSPTRGNGLQAMVEKIKQLATSYS
ncbi:SufE family protein [Aliikangiella coralliicola]|uniref:SufE family protein n=1 Tax=Aliikangiella coralliicola TaxID=2592383 RepID=A0A545UDF5_9GAMM|nr:SufE family protein [Aliikangiella coralliicola]TQV87504.1 SufE family protein [Aliikangiella coralliicola]